MITVAISQSNYIPWKGYFDMIRRADYFVFYDVVQYTNRDWRNRNKILTPSGLFWLTVPVRYRYREQTINQIEIADNSWQAKHWKTLQQNYSKAPYFDLYAEQLEEFYHRDWLYLSDLNQSLIILLSKFLQIRTNFIRAESLIFNSERNQRLIDICQSFNATHYLSGPAAQAYLDVGKFNQHGIEVKWMQYDHYPSYQQLHQPFEHAVSVLDLLFNTGPKALAYL